MSTKFPGGFITKNYVAPTPSSASGIWTLDQQEQAQQAGIWPFGGPFTYIEDVFSTWLYTGTGASQTITNGIDLSTKGGLTWIKSRSAATDHKLTDTARGVTKALISDTTGAQTTDTTGLTAFGTTGFTIGADANYNTSAATYASWTWRKQPKFFDVVTYTGDGSTLKTISHNLGSVPGCMIIKSTSSASWNWIVYHRSLGISQKIQLNLTDAAVSENGNFGGTSPTSTQFSVGYNATNESGGTYVAYLFAHNAGGFGLTGTDNVISCGSYTGNGSTVGPTVTLGYEPQFVMVKNTSNTGNWVMLDIMRGMPDPAVINGALIYANTSGAETSNNWMGITATGFYLYGANFNVNASANNYIYIAIRRGPMKVPTDATKVFYPSIYTGTNSAQSITGANFPPDLVMGLNRTSGISISGVTPAFIDRLRGVSAGGTPQIFSSNSSQETNTTEVSALTMTGFNVSSISSGNWNYSGSTYVAEMFQRAPSFFDEVCYTGTGSNTAYTHNLGVAPELMIIKSRNDVNDWAVYSSAIGNTANLRLNTTAASSTALNLWVSTTPSATTFTTNGTYNLVGGATVTYVAYLFATCAGVSKVGSYTGNGTTQTIDCGFTAGARFVLLKRTDAVGGWYVYDTARGMTTLTDPYLQLNSSAAETATLGSVTTVSTGFAVNATVLAAINTNAATYIFLAIA